MSQLIKTFFWHKSKYIGGPKREVVQGTLLADEMENLGNQWETGIIEFIPWVRIRLQNEMEIEIASMEYWEGIYYFI